MRVVESAGRDALVELRRIVGVLHRGSDALAGRVCTRPLAAGRARRPRARRRPAGRRARRRSRFRRLSPGLDLVAYRVVQEALTNVIKHAGPARARVNVTVATDCLELEVSDNGHGATPDRSNHRDPGTGSSE